MSATILNRELCDFLIVGAGIIGIAIARELRRRFKGRVMVIDKESKPGFHASGRNSGVLHAGVYYKEDTLKARLCVEGNRRLKEYCWSRQIPMNNQGKVIVTTHLKELPALKELHQRAQANGVRAELVNSESLREIEPCAKTVGQALYIRDTAVVNPENVVEAMANDSISEGIEFAYNRTWIKNIRPGEIQTTQGVLSFGHLVNCGGLFADKIAHAMNVGREFKILPFRGNFCFLDPTSQVRVRGNIYPVPDLRDPFLGVHFTKRPEGEITVGPSALPLFGREQYEGIRGANLSDAVSMMAYLARLFRKNRNHFRSFAWKELLKVSRYGFFKEADRLTVGLKKSDLVTVKGVGIRAQLVNGETAELVNDFVVENGPRSTHILNAVSPAFTCSLPFAEYVVDSMKVEC